MQNTSYATTGKLRTTLEAISLHSYTNKDRKNSIKYEEEDSMKKIVEACRFNTVLL